ncbi:MAG: hypothetical protein V4695_08750 [Pseudomonadota bacterium]
MKATIDLDGVATNLSRIDSWRVCKAETTGFILDDTLQLSLQPADLGKLQELLMVVKYGFS